MKSEANFIRELEARAVEQHKLVATEILPSWARGVGEWLVVNPWRVIMPMALLAYSAWRIVYGENAREIILAIFGGY